MRNAIPERERWLALAILLALLALGYLLLVHPWWTVPMRELGARIETLQQRDLRARMVLSQAPELRERTEAFRERVARLPGFLPERSPELATAALVQRLETAVAEASPGNRSCAIINRSPLNDVRAQRFPRVVVQARMRCGSPELAAVLYALESGTPRLFVDNLNILSQAHYMAAEQAGQGVGLDVSFDLYGYLQPAPGSADAP
ncbi:type II secretion system protein GspM [Luteimonas sp. RD2P54]|uniref:Type II secretion system protein GspM n=1 Tax=Luteimonas endophytica TaxID=3042023 RepID=A0ABT6J6A1_9GAMM|nr:type II secretion system protein GspM [Luteimonas endophytica]MDH5822356.1 type II secretion system protein GspM [Luteimonas endophytica]